MSTAIKLFSAGAVKPGLVKVIDAFRREHGADVNITFATAPAILNQCREGASADIVIAPPAVLDELMYLQKVSRQDRVTLGRIGVGVMVRDGATLPQIATVAEFQQSLIGADSVVYNQASTGTYLEALFDRLGIAAQLAAKTTRYRDFAAVLDHVGKGKGRELGFGATTVIIENAGEGVKFAGPLPGEIQNHTAYAAVMIAGAANDAAQEFLRYLTSPIARSQLAAAGIA